MQRVAEGVRCQALDIGHACLNHNKLDPDPGARDGLFIAAEMQSGVIMSEEM